MKKGIDYIGVGVGKENKNKFFIGKVADFVKRKGWFFGHFMDEKLLCSDLVEVAWQDISNKRPKSADKHYHKHSVEINIVISGWVKLVINNKRFTVNKGEFYIIYPFTVVENVEAGENTEVIVVRTPSLSSDKFQGNPFR